MGSGIVTETIYDTMGRVHYSYLPYFENIDTPQWITYEYDQIGRLGKVINPNGKYTERKYALWTTTLIDANFHKKEEDRDAYGRLAQRKG
ncbi:MAG: hypothetical protein WA133_08245 [Syntrophales bacterium]